MSWDKTAAANYAKSHAGGNPGGHRAIFDGSEWYSDFRQRDMWAGPGYRAAKPTYIIYSIPYTALALLSRPRRGLRKSQQNTNRLTSKKGAVWLPFHQQ